MGFLDRIKGGREQRQLDGRARDYRSRVDGWLADCSRAVERSLSARNPGVASGNAPIQLWENERLLVWWTGGELIAPTHTVVREWAGASYRVGPKTTVRAGASTTRATIDRPTPIDRGTLAITDRRVVFLGRTRSLDWQFRRLIGVTHDPSGTWSAIHVSNSQRLHGVGYPRSHGDEVHFYLALGLALYRDEQEAFAKAIENDTLRLVGSPPTPPPGVPIDER